MDSIGYDFGEEAPRYRKKSKKNHVKSDHKHEYERVCVDAHAVSFRRGHKVPYMYLVDRCKICGRIGDLKMQLDLHEPPTEMPLYEVADFWELLGMKMLPDGMRVR